MPASSAPDAGELIQTWVLAMSQRLKIGAVATMIAPYPTLGEASKRAAGAFYTPKLFSERTRWLVRLLARSALARMKLQPRPALRYTAGTMTDPRSYRPRWLTGLSGRLLALTIAFVMLAEVLIYVPRSPAFARSISRSRSPRRTWRRWRWRRAPTTSSPTRWPSTC